MILAVSITEKYFSLLSILPAVMWLMIILVAGFMIKGSHPDKPYYKYYMPNLYAKLFFSFAFAMVYLLYYGGGDTVAYYDGAVTLNNLFSKSPELYFEQMATVPNRYQYTAFYDIETGYPPGWIFREPQGFFICKIMSLFSFVTLKSYLAMTFIMAFITSHAAWKLFELIRSYNMSNEKMLAFGVLLLPSVNFWCAGISKDTVVFIATLYLVYHAFHIISIEQKSSLKNYVFVLLAAFVIYHVRMFILIAILLPIMFAIMTRMVRAFGGGNMAVVLIRTLVLVGGLGVAGGALINQSEADFLASNSFLGDAAVIQDDFATNATYGDKKYDLGTVEFSPVGLLKVMPLTIITGIFRPFLWEARSVTLLINGLESVLFIYFTYLFFRKNVREKWRVIKGHEFLIFCLIFVFVVAFMTGLTSILYGVLVRLRAPLLPFFFILLTIDWDVMHQKRLIKPEE